MGTSTSHSGPATWGPTKGAITSALNDGAVLSDEKLQKVVSKFVSTLASAASPSGLASAGAGGGKSSARSGGGRGGGGRGGGGGGSGGGGRGGRKSTSVGGIHGAAGRMASFLSDVSQNGFQSACAKCGLDHIDNLSPEEIALALAMALCEGPAIFDEVDVANALGEVLTEALQGATTDQIEGRLQDLFSTLESTLQHVIGAYIFERFASFSQSSLNGKSMQDTQRYTDQVRDYIRASLENMQTSGQRLDSINWSGPQGANEIERIIKDVQDVFGEG